MIYCASLIHVNDSIQPFLFSIIATDVPFLRSLRGGSLWLGCRDSSPNSWVTASLCGLGANKPPIPASPWSSMSPQRGVKCFAGNQQTIWSQEAPHFSFCKRQSRYGFKWKKCQRQNISKGIWSKLGRLCFTNTWNHKWNGEFGNDVIVKGCGIRSVISL